MAPQVIFKPAMGPARCTHLQSQTLIDDSGAATTVGKMTDPAIPTTKGSNSLTTGPKVEEIKKAEKAEQVEKGKEKEDPRFDTFHPFPRLPNEIKAMVLSEYIDFEPSIIYASCKANKKVPGLIDVNTGKDGALSKFKCLAQLMKGIPGFKAYVKRTIGVSFHDLSYHPEKGVRKGKDLMVLVFDNKMDRHLNWYGATQRKHNREYFVPDIEDIGVMYDRDRLYGLGLGAGLQSSSIHPCSSQDLSMLVTNLGAVKNFYLLVKLHGSQAEQKKWMKIHLAIAKLCSKDLMVFEDKDRTWVEITQNKARRQYGTPVQAAGDLLRRTDKLYHAIGTMCGGSPKVHFRILVASRFKNKTLGLWD
ncbi:hypothetical protein BDP55DRAFT_749092 [Colletotrichum godetiae]|uniref:Uncharacterized protein n=1 Tax=Colletotrichum godetiae TaxID=1209918 RepID=A0AAJ0AHC7_9PEZI|nr:uncharacterized protein BDP55DRAFT_749092 [Colletotrichum godetiae]KAK1673289.1 hypothetical protein BDP55DRAFT_749092 [Colletotrichum godetiae]